jgi:hypothetical protein
MLARWRLWAWAAAGILLAGRAVAQPPPPPQSLPPPAPALETPLHPPTLLPETSPSPPTPASAPDSCARPGLAGPLLRPLETNQEDPLPTVPPPPELFQVRQDPPPGFTGPSSVLPREEQTDNHFVPVEDRWRIGFPAWDRYDRGHPPLDDYPYDVGHWFDPYHQHVLKGDYPILGQNTFLEVTALSESLFEVRQIPTATTPFESTANPGQRDFFGKPNQFFYNQILSLSFDLFHGDAAFKPVDWRVKLTPAFDVNYLSVEELAVVNPDVTKGTTRGRTFATLEEWFVEKKLADLSPYYDFVSVRVGSQPFVSDFRGFIFSDANRAVRLFGTRESNRDQFNVIYFNQQEKDTNSDLNTFEDRHQQVLIANYYRQDFIWPGYTIQGSVHYNHDSPSFHFDKNDFLVRPDPAGVFKPHGLDVVYLGLTGDGHINRFNITHAFYWALGHDTLNPIGNQAQEINAQMAAVEFSYNRDWARFRASVFWSSGDGNPNNKHATGFDTINDNPNFAGGEFSFWQRQAIPLFGVKLVNRFSLVPDLRASKFEGQSNFVNPGLLLVNAGVDFDLTPKLKMINNWNLLWFDKTAALEQFVFQGNITRFIGGDISAGFEYRPLLSNNVITRLGVSTLIPGQGFMQLYNKLHNDVNPLVAAFLQLNLLF